MRVRTIFHLWLPLAVSFELMMLEGPTIQGAIGYLPQSPLNLAAWGLTMSVSMLIESPVIMLLSTAIALAQDADSYRALRRFMVNLAVGCTLLSGLVAFTPLFGFVAGRWMGQPPAFVAAAQPAMRIMLFWTAAIAWRRLHQGILVRCGQTQRVSLGTGLRLVATAITAVGLAYRGDVPGVQVGALAIMAAVLTEAAATTYFALPVIRRDILLQPPSEDPPLTQRAIWRFHAPLAATTLLTLLALPLTSAALARLAKPEVTLAAWPVTFMALLVLRGWGLALQEITVAQARDPRARPALRRFAWMVGVATSLVTALLVCTPLLDLYFKYVIHLAPDLYPYAHLGVAVAVFLPFLSALGSWARGLLVAGGAPQEVYYGMGLNLATHGALLWSGVALRLPGMWVAAAAYSLAALGEFVYLLRRASARNVL